MKCNVYETTESGQKLVGSLSLVKNRIVINRGAENRVLLNNVRKMRGPKGITADKNPAVWLKNLPKVLTGAYLRAELVES